MVNKFARQESDLEASPFFARPKNANVLGSIMIGCGAVAATLLCSGAAFIALKMAGFTSTEKLPDIRPHHRIRP